MTDTAGLEGILDETRKALMAGDLAALAGLALAAEQTLTRLKPDCTPEAAERLAQKARPNERLITAALRGMKAATRRVRELTDDGRFSTYDANGRRNQPGLASPAAARRI